MSLSFPASPSDNQVYQNWRWNAGAQSWDSYIQQVNTWMGRSGDVTMTAGDLRLAGGDTAEGERVLLKSDKITGTMGWVEYYDVFNQLSLYDIYEVEWNGLRPSYADGTLAILLHNGGSSIPDAGPYAYALLYQGSDNTSYSGGTVSGSNIPMGGTQVGRYCSGVARLYMPNTSDRPKHVWFKESWYGASHIYTVEGVGLLWNARWLNPVTSWRLDNVGGDFDAGVVNWYGIGNGPNRG